jgi:hypothetical protein
LRQRPARDLARARPDTFRPNLATSLNNLSPRLGDLGRREDALTAIEEVVTIRREQAARWADARRHQLDRSLQIVARLEHGKDLSDASRRSLSSDKPKRLITATAERP